jgi:hypothetical protein
MVTTCRLRFGCERTGSYLCAVVVFLNATSAQLQFEPPHHRRALATYSLFLVAAAAALPRVTFLPAAALACWLARRPAASSPLRRTSYTRIADGELDAGGLEGAP